MARNLLDTLAQKFAGKYSKRALKRLIDQGKCTVNGQVERHASTAIPAGARVHIDLYALATPKSSTLPILYEDSLILAVNKPAGISVDRLELPQGAQLAHRLDRYTSGVLLLGKTPEGLKRLEALFRGRQIQKRYLALVEGVPKQPQGRIANFLAPRKELEGQTLWGRIPQSHQAKAALTLWKIHKRGKHAALLLCQPQTGRTHQIRVHLSEMGHPILGDPLYRPRPKFNITVPRCMLHAGELRFAHPITGEAIEIRAPLPPDFQDCARRVLNP